MKKKFICIIFFVLTACECPTGTYRDSSGYLWELRTEGGMISGVIRLSNYCGGDFYVNGTSNGTNIDLYASCQDAQTNCCNPVVYMLKNTGDCSVLMGTYSFPPESSCSFLDGGSTTLVKME